MANSNEPDIEQLYTEANKPVSATSAQPTAPGKEWTDSDWEKAAGIVPEPPGQVAGLVKGLAKGAWYGLPDLAAGAAQMVGRSFGFGKSQTLEDISKWGQEGMATPYEKNLGEKTGEMTAESILPSMILMGAGKIVSMLPIPGAAGVGAAMQIGGKAIPWIFGMSRGEQTYQAAEAAGVDPGMAPIETAAVTTAAFTAATHMFGKILGPLGKIGSEAFGKLTPGAALKNTVLGALKQQAFVTAPTAISVVAGQAGINAEIERRSGIRPEADPWAEAAETVGPTALMTALMSPVGIVGQRYAAARQADILATPVDPNTRPEIYTIMQQNRRNVRDGITDMMPKDEALQKQWKDYTDYAIDNHLPIRTDMPFDTLAIQNEDIRSRAADLAKHSGIDPTTVTLEQPQEKPVWEMSQDEIRANDANKTIGIDENYKQMRAAQPVKPENITGITEAENSKVGLREVRSQRREPGEILDIHNLVDKDDNIVGGISKVTNTFTGAERLGEVFLDPEYRGKGMGGHLRDQFPDTPLGSAVTEAARKSEAKWQAGREAAATKPTVSLISDAAKTDALGALKSLKFGVKESNEAVEQVLKAKPDLDTPGALVTEAMKVLTQSKGKILAAREGEIKNYTMSGADALKSKLQAKRTVVQLKNSGTVAADSPVRFTNEKEIDSILRDKKLLIGKDFEGKLGISARDIKPGQETSDFAAPGNAKEKSVAIVFPKEAKESAGEGLNEVKINPDFDVTKLHFIVDGKLLSYKDMASQRGIMAAREGVKGPEGVLGYIKKNGGMDFAKGGYNPREVRQQPDGKRIHKKGAQGPDQWAAQLKSKGYTGFEDGKDLAEKILSGKARDIFTPENQDKMNEHRIAAGEPGYIEQQMANEQHEADTLKDLGSYFTKNYHEAEAKRAGVTYNGEQENVKGKPPLQLFTDSVTGSTFVVKSGTETVTEARDRNRQKFIQTGEYGYDDTGKFVKKVPGQGAKVEGAGAGAGEGSVSGQGEAGAGRQLLTKNGEVIYDHRVQGDTLAVPALRYTDAANVDGNPWIRRSATKEGNATTNNKGRSLMVQFSSNLDKTGVVDKFLAMFTKYYDLLYSGVRKGYDRLSDFWEIPQWMGFVSHVLPDADVYVVRDMEKAKAFLNDAGYDRALFSAMGVNEKHIRELAKSYKGEMHVGGSGNAKTFAGIKNITWHDNLQSLAEAFGVEYKDGVDYRHFEGAKVIPRLTMSQGCLHKCAFCDVVRTLTESTPESIQQQAEAIAALKTPLIYLNDKTFGQAENYTKLSDLYQQVKAINPDFDGFIIQTTAPALLKMDDAWIKTSGIKYVEIGVESYNDSILRNVHKPHNTKLIDDATEKARANGLRLIPNIIIGMEGETEQTYNRTLAYLDRNADVISHANIYALAIHQGSELSKTVKVMSEGDIDENVLAKSFHTEKETHEQFADRIYGKMSDQLIKNADAIPDTHKNSEVNLSFEGVDDRTEHLPDGQKKAMTDEMIDTILLKPDGTNKLAENFGFRDTNIIRSYSLWTDPDTGVTHSNPGGQVVIGIGKEGLTASVIARLRGLAASIGTIFNQKQIGWTQILHEAGIKPGDMTVIRGISFDSTTIKPHENKAIIEALQKHLGVDIDKIYIIPTQDGFAIVNTDPKTLDPAKLNPAIMDIVDKATGGNNYDLFNHGKTGELLGRVKKGDANVSYQEILSAERSKRPYLSDDLYNARTEAEKIRDKYLADGADVNAARNRGETYIPGAAGDITYQSLQRDNGLPGFNQAGVQRIADHVLTFHMPGIQKLVSVVQDKENIPIASARDAVVNDPHPETITAFTDRASGRVFIISSHLTSPDQIARSLIHEGIGHIGVRQVLGDEAFNSFVQKVYDFYGRDAIDAALTGKGYTLDHLTEEGRLHAGEEMFANLEHDSPSLWQELCDRITVFARSLGKALGFDTKFDESDIRYALAQGKAYVERPNTNTSYSADSKAIMMARLAGSPEWYRKAILSAKDIYSAKDRDLSPESRGILDNISDIVKKNDAKAYNWWRTVFSRPFWDAVAHPATWGPAWRIFGEQRPERRSILNEKFLGGMKDFFQNSDPASVARISKILIAGDAFKGALPGMTKEHLSESKALDRFPDQLLKDGITIKGETIKLNDAEIRAYKNVRGSLALMWKENFDHIQEQALREYRTSHWFSILLNAHGLINEETLQRLGAVDLKTIGKAASKDLRVKIRDVFKNLEEGRDKLTPEQKTKLLTKYENTYAMTLNGIKGVQDVMRTNFGLEGKELDKASQEIITAYLRTRPSMKAISDARAEFGDNPHYFPRTRARGDYAMQVFQTIVDEQGNPTQKKVFETFYNGKQSEAAKILRRIHAEKDITGKSAFSENGKLKEGFKVQTEKTKATPEWAYHDVNDVNTYTVMNNAFDRIKDSGADSDAVDKLKDQAIKAVAQEINARGWGHNIPRKNTLITGYEEENLKDVLTNYTYGLAGKITKQEAARDFFDHMVDVKKNTNDARLYESLAKYGRDNLRNPSEVDRAVNWYRHISFLWYLGGLIRAPLLHFSANYTWAIPELNSVIRANKVDIQKYGLKMNGLAEYHKAMKDMREVVPKVFIKGQGALKDMDFSKLPAHEAEFLHKFMISGVGRAQFIDDIIRPTMQAMPKYLQSFSDFMVRPFQSIITFNRMSAGLAMFRTQWALDTATGKVRPEDRQQHASREANNYVYRTQGAFSRANYNPMEAGGGIPAGMIRGALTFRSFMHQYVLWAQHAISKKDFRAVGESMAWVAMFGGLMVMPFMKDILDMITKHTGYNPTQAIRDTMRKYGGETLEKVGMTGLPSLLGFKTLSHPVVGIPFVGDSPLSTLTGSAGGLITSEGRAYQALTRGDYFGAIGYGAPQFISAPFTGLRQSEVGKDLGMQGFATTAHGKPIFGEDGQPLQYKTSEVLTKAVGLYPTRIAEETAKSFNLREVESYFTQKRQEIADTYRVAKNLGKAGALPEMMKEIQKFNSDLTDRNLNKIIPRITVSSIIKSGLGTKTKKQRGEISYLQ